MSEIKAPFYLQKSLADILLGMEMPRWKRKILRFLLPSAAYDLPEQEVATIQKGTVIGNIVINTIDPICSDDLSLSWGCSDDPR